MEDGAVALSETRSDKMVASNTNSSARKAILQERKRQIEEALTKRNLELRQLCIQEAELTGITPPEMPLDDGETPPIIRRKVGTSYQLNENLLNNTNKDELIASLELQLQVHTHLAEAALGLSVDNGNSKTVKRLHRAEYQKFKAAVHELQEKLATVLKEKAASEQIKQKKKPRVPEPQDDTVSVMTLEPYSKPGHSQVSVKHSLSMLSPTDTYPEARYPPGSSRPLYNRHSENVYMHYPKPDDVVNSGFYRLSLNGYNEYIEKRHETSVAHYYPPQHTYNYAHASLSQPVLSATHFSQQHGPRMLPGSPQMSQHGPHLSQSNQHLPHHSPQLPQHFQHSLASPQHSPMMHQHSIMLPQQNQLLPNLSPILSQQHSPMLLQQSLVSPQQGLILPQLSPMSQHSPISQHSPQVPSHSPQLSNSPLPQHAGAGQRAPQNYSRMNQQYAQFYRQSSPTASNSVSSLGKVQHYPSHTIHGEPGYSRYTMDATSGYRNTVDGSGFRNQHPIQPHQQYEQNGMNTGLGGYWKRSDNGEMIWVYSTTTLDGAWQRDKRFGSLDRRRNKRVQNRTSTAENKSATLATMPVHSDQVKTAFVKPSQVASRRTQDHRQLVRTQSLGSVGQTIDSVYPSDTSSCESDNRSLMENRAVRKQKEKEWLETSLDGPISPTHSVISRSQSTIPTALAPEDQYVVHTPPPLPQLSPSMSLHINPHLNPIHHNVPLHRQNIPSPIPLQSPRSPKPLLEIPAESNPSHRVPEPTYMELLNNNIPKHCTVVQAGACKPYHEETKPFEMSDFYKYSTKFKKSPHKKPAESLGRAPGGDANQNSMENYEGAGNNRYSSGQPMQQEYAQHSNTLEATSTSSNLNTNLVDERFSEEMNAWYDKRDHHNENNNSGGTKKNRSSATLV